MAEEAFALSPISARAALPSEADYDAIREAFMETARGRWFLSEYTKRNRNADTTMVLEAVTRMEANLAAQKQAPSTVSLIESLGAIRAAIRDAKVIAAEAMPRFDDDDTLAAARNGARIIREIAWTLRECGADTRICDLLDAQVQAIEAGQQRTANGDGRADVLASYDVLVQRIEQLATPDAPRAAPTEAPVAASAERHASSVTPLFRAAVEAAAEITEPLRQVPAEASMLDELAELAAEVAAASVDVAQVERPIEKSAPHLPETTLAPSEPIVPMEIAATPSEVETAEDEAVLDMVAMEMAAADPSEPVIAIAEIEAPVALEEMRTPEPIAEVSDSPSLGAALIANGVIGDPGAPASDPLAPIRRMSQAEKVAFFS